MKILELVAQDRCSQEALRFAEDLSTGLVAAGCGVWCVFLGTSEFGSRERRGVKETRLGPAYPFQAYDERLQAVLDNLPLSGCVVDVWKESGPFDLVIAHEWSTGLAASLLKRVFKVPLLAVLHGCQVESWGGRGTKEQLFAADMERWLCERADHVSVESESVQKEVVKHYGITEARISVMPCAGSMESLQCSVDREEFRAMFGKPEEDIVFFPGPMTHQKGPDILLEAARGLLKARPETKFLFSGDGELRDILCEKAVEYGLTESVRFTGSVGPLVVDAMYQIADLVVLPSRYEAFGRFALEAVLHGKPVVAHAVGGIPALARTLQTKLLQQIPFGDTQSFSKAMSVALSTRASGREGDDVSRVRGADSFSRERAAQTVVRLGNAIIAAGQENVPVQPATLQ